MKIEIEKLSPSVLLKEGRIGCVIFKRGETTYGWYTGRLMSYFRDKGWDETGGRPFRKHTYGIPGEFLE